MWLGYLGSTARCAQTGPVKELADDVRIEPTKGGFLASSARWGVAAAGQTSDEAIQRLSDLIVLAQELDRRVAAGGRTTG